MTLGLLNCVDPLMHCLIIINSQRMREGYNYCDLIGLMFLQNGQALQWAGQSDYNQQHTIHSLPGRTVNVALLLVTEPG